MADPMIYRTRPPGLKYRLKGPLNRKQPTNQSNGQCVQVRILAIHTTVDTSPRCTTLKSKYWIRWMTCDFTSFSTVSQSCHDDERMIMKACVQWNPAYA